MLKVHEIFQTIQGEGYDTGVPVIFIRLYGCNLKCSYCDQDQSGVTPREVTVGDIVGYLDKCNTNAIKNICITGGEPLMQEDTNFLIDILVEYGYNVSVETNGAILLRENREDRERKFKYVMDLKTPSSGMEKMNCLENLNRLTSQDEIKCVVADDTDLIYVKEVLLNAHNCSAKILISPMFDENDKPVIDGKTLCKTILNDPFLVMKNVRVQLQIHKILGFK